MRRDVAAYSVLISLAEISTLKLISNSHSHTRHRAQFESYPQTATVYFLPIHTVLYFKCSICII
jgi:hypothetical protein